ncbi:hypothetical protein CH373_05260 [Leptospira perolatii]|uniref:Carrier domain-containing protein n=1 Tax=Leptospira perolatii TaxID=2023191 RepID=A0A2M9ZQF8_9LEPT|nr:acyl carrier protein [Leptospira perolatii]PJZ70482.1 hypothetical protein CH360_05680 [Leptospira perolatii]PJZ74318.1 hypothetical protein CH373_05260 [Leptospira perolatii]
MSELASIDLRQEVTSLVCEVVKNSTGREVEISTETKLIRDGYLDSLSMVNLVLRIQSNYGIQVEISEMEESNFGSVDRISKFIYFHRENSDRPKESRE